MTNVKKITIIVDASGNGSIDPEVTQVRTADTLLQFNLVSIGYIFPDVAAVVVAGSNVPFYGPWTMSPNEANLVDRRPPSPPPASVYYYGINILNTATNETRPLQFGAGIQPRIENKE